MRENVKANRPRRYGQFCGLARSLDVVGDRWSLLIVRELLGRPARYGELAAGLPGIATNLLAERLRHLETTGIVERHLDTQGSGVLYQLTEWGQQLRDPIEALIRWSTPLMVTGKGDDEFRPHWLAPAIRALLHDRTSSTPETVGLEIDGVLLAVQVDEDGAYVSVNPATRPRTVLRADPEVVLALAAGAMTAREAAQRSTLTGRQRDLRAVFSTRP
jgi:DNA-binding HxlR family transcriptional regulator